MLVVLPHEIRIVEQFFSLIIIGLSTFPVRKQNLDFNFELFLIQYVVFNLIINLFYIFNLCRLLRLSSITGNSCLKILTSVGTLSSVTFILQFFLIMNFINHNIFHIFFSNQFYSIFIRCKVSMVLRSFVVSHRQIDRFVLPGNRIGANLYFRQGISQY